MYLNIYLMRHINNRQNISALLKVGVQKKVKFFKLQLILLKQEMDSWFYNYNVHASMILECYT